METKQVKHQSISNEVAIPDTTTEITNQRIHTNTLSGERAVCECSLVTQKVYEYPKNAYNPF